MSYNSELSRIWSDFDTESRRLRAVLERDISELRLKLASDIDSARRGAQEKAELLKAETRAARAAPKVKTPEEIAAHEAETRRRFELRERLHAERAERNRIESDRRRRLHAEKMEAMDRAMTATFEAEVQASRDRAEKARIAADVEAANQAIFQAERAKRVPEVTLEAERIEAEIRERAKAPGLTAAQKGAIFQEAAQAWEDTFIKAGIPVPEVNLK